MGTIHSNGVVINYRCAGFGRDVVLIHGLATNHAFWHLNVLLPLIKKYRVTVYDLRGHGYSEMPPSGYTTADMAGDLHNILNHLGIRSAHLVGHSFGGAIALHYAALHPERVDGLVLADTRVRALQPHQRLKDWPDWQKVAERIEKLGLVVRDDETEASLCLLEQLASPKWREARKKCRGEPLFIPFSGLGGGNRLAEQWLKLINTTTAVEDFKSLAGLTIDKISRINHQTLAVYGEKSTVLQSLRGLMEHLPNCRSVVIPDVGHFHPLLRPKKFIDIVLQFLIGLDSNASKSKRGLSKTGRVVQIR